MDTLLPLIKSEGILDSQSTLNVLNEFITKNESIFIFPSVGQEEYQNLLWKLVNFSTAVDSRISLKAYCVMKLLSRDQNLVNSIQNIEQIMEVIKPVITKTSANNDQLTKVECLKCVCNWLYHSAKIRHVFSEQKLWISLLKDISKPDTIIDAKYYEVRIIFLLSALEASLRNDMLNENVLNVLIDFIQELNTATEYRNYSEQSFPSFRVKILCEILRTLFNVILALDDTLSSTRLNEIVSLSMLLRNMIVDFQPFDNESADDLLTSIVHLLINIPKVGIKEFLEKFNENDDTHVIDLNAIMFDRLKYFKHQDAVFDMTPVIILVQHLAERLKIENYMSMKEKTFAILTAFCYICRINPPVRKYLRKEVLPNCSPSEVNPENEDSIRGKVVQLMTTVDVSLKNMAADFLFVLCKESPDRLIRYCGYGNSAGYLFSRGIMVSEMSHVDGDYSEDELSDIEGDLDLMTGSTAKQTEDPMAHLTASEKEAELENLFCMMDRLKELNVIRPVVVDGEGKLTEFQSDENKQQ